MGALDRVVKAYDVRGLVPADLGPAEVGALAAGFADLLVAEARGSGAKAGPVVLGRDVRTSSPELAAAVVDGVTSAGLDVVDIGLASTDQLYFASGWLDHPGVMVTASHNPAAYNGLKLCRSGARPVGRDTGLVEVQRSAQARLDRPPPARSAPSAGQRGSVLQREVLGDYAAHLRALAPLAGRRLRVVVDAANAMAGHTVPVVLGPLDIDLVPVYFELDGTFPNHPPDPLDPATLTDLRAAVRAHDADVGLAFDGDADRCFVVDERGDPVSPSAVTGLIAVRALATEPGARVVHNVVCSRAVPEVVREHGGVPVRTPVGHSLIKAEMARSGAVVGGEHSGHYYFRDFWYADSGLLAALHVLAALAESALPLSGLLAPYERYVASGERNHRVTDPVATVAAVGERWAAADGVGTDELDGLTVSHAGWWFNLRASNTEPLLRLNVEGVDAATMIRVRDEVESLVRGEGTA